MNHCQNGGTCLTGINEAPFFCICPEGYVGIDCNETEKGEELTLSQVLPCPGPAPLVLVFSPSDG